jgi:hypothetical protein
MQDVQTWRSKSNLNVAISLKLMNFSLQFTTWTHCTVTVTNLDSSLLQSWYSNLKFKFKPECRNQPEIDGQMNNYSSQLEHAQSQLPTWIQGFLNHLTRIMKFDLPWSMCVLSAEVVLHIPTVLTQNNFVDMKMDYDHSMAFEFRHLTGRGAMRVHCNCDMVKFSSYSYYRVFNLFKAHISLAPKSTLCMQPDLQQYRQLSSVILSQLYRTQFQKLISATCLFHSTLTGLRYIMPI